MVYVTNRQGKTYMLGYFGRHQSDCETMKLDKNMFPDVTWENSPVKKTVKRSMFSRECWTQFIDNKENREKYGDDAEYDK
jgi:hypothetical protein